MLIILRSFKKNSSLFIFFIILGCSQNDAFEQNEEIHAEYVGGENCLSCHTEQFSMWENSHHELAMLDANQENILANFDNIKFEYNDVESLFYKEDAKYWVRTDNEKGEMESFQISYTFGAYPLQQYLIDLGNGKFNALSIAWDSRPKNEGGQKWFHLYPENEEVNFDDPLHWTGTFQNWNSICAECHSTNLIKNFSISDNSYNTSFSSINVDCESCHGAGSNHIENPYENKLALSKDPNTWQFEIGEKIAKRIIPEFSHEEINTCGQCHSRRSQLTDQFSHGDNLLDGYQISLLDEGLYHADGQIDDEVYVYGSFLQSKMYQAGVTCSDCHDPHTAKLKFEDNALCGQCHLASSYDTPQHHYHTQNNEGALCVNCHMPEKTYMVVDPRRDHGFKIPRPDLSLDLNVPNACSSCHNEYEVQFLAEKVSEWFPEGIHKQTKHFGYAIESGRKWGKNRHNELKQLLEDENIPAIVKATAISLLSRQIDDEVVDIIQVYLDSDEPLIQLSALDALDNVQLEYRIELAQSFLTNPLRSIRMSAARVLLPVASQLNEKRILDFNNAIKEYQDAQIFNSDRAEGLINLSNLALYQNNLQEAEDILNRAIISENYFAPAYINLADIYQQTGRNNDSISLLNEALKFNSLDANLYYSLALAYVRNNQYKEALDSLSKAVELSPNDPHLHFAMNIALNDYGDKNKALTNLKQSHEKFQGYKPIILALATISRDLGRKDEAISYVEKLLEISPRDRSYQNLLNELR
ncbi:MAG: hypothetical protein CBC38_07555 [Gammaproteobacteria bacterium TMED78]|nr:MAG: hypothetical protein CBC38_07555 [Gammaproteobacteria bacterium TMED78]|tara:strand:+ start:2280 stop:4547 length:2268 start_codon:yes stop_codon:yes gene_type:complete